MNRMPSPITPARPTICVFCGSSHGADPVYTEAARAFGTRMVESGFDLVFGGGGVGLMGEVALSVSNAGIPIPSSVLECIFQPFSRGAARSHQQGLGLGLYIAAEIARAHGGMLEAISSADETRFTFRMPLVL